MTQPDSVQTEVASHSSAQGRVKHYTSLLILSLVLLLAFVCVLLLVLEGWIAVFLLGIENNEGGLGGFVVFNILAVALFLLLMLVGCRLLRARKRPEGMSSPADESTTQG